MARNDGWPKYRNTEPRDRSGFGEGYSRVCGLCGDFHEVNGPCSRDTTPVPFDDHNPYPEYTSEHNRWEESFA